MEGEGYSLQGYSVQSQMFKLYGGRGMIDVNQFGTFEVKFKKYGDHISISKPHVLAKNIIFGTLFIDLDGYLKCKNHVTGHYIEIKFFQRHNATDLSQIQGEGFDANGVKLVEIFGSWLDEIKIKTIATGKVESIFKEKPLPQNAHLQYFFSKCALLLNYKSDEMVGTISPTDSRWRGDLRLYEEGKIDEADVEKTKIEEEQRRKRAMGRPHEANFFQKVEQLAQRQKKQKPLQL